LQQIKQQHNCKVTYTPVLLGGLFKATGNSSPVTVPAKGRYMLEDDLPRFSALYCAPLNANPFFPINTLNLMRGAIYALDKAFFNDYINAIFDAVWVEQKNMADIVCVTQTLQQAGLNAEDIIAGTQLPEVKSQLIENTEAAVKRGLFGVPTFFVDNQMYFGQDRLNFVEIAVANETSE
jgi:2-hydroxychromene-2-carboxylate isomerase